MNIPLRIPAARKVSSLVAIGVFALAIGFKATEVTAQATSTPAVAATHSVMSEKAPTNAQLQEEINELRKQIVQLQQTEKGSAQGTNPPSGGMAMEKAGKKKCKEA
jgi:hypothetical protein